MGKRLPPAYSGKYYSCFIDSAFGKLYETSNDCIRVVQNWEPHFILLPVKDVFGSWHCLKTVHRRKVEDLYGDVRWQYIMLEDIDKEKKRKIYHYHYEFHDSWIREIYDSETIQEFLSWVESNNVQLVVFRDLKINLSDYAIPISFSFANEQDEIYFTLRWS